MGGTRNSISAVLPCYNEGAHLSKSLETIRGALERLERDFEMILIDDGSTDNTWAVLKEVCGEDPRCRALRLSRRFGKELALCAGLEQSRGDAVIVMDADLQHPPSMIATMVEHWEKEGFDLVEGVKTDRGAESPISRVCAGLFYNVFHWLSSFDLEGASDFKLMDRKVLEAWIRLPERNVFFRGMSAWLGFRRKKLPFAVEARAGGQTRWSPLDLLRLAVSGITSFSSLPVHIVTTIGLGFLVFSGFLGTLALVQKLQGVAVTGFTTVIILQLMIGSMVMIGLGIIGEYISKIYDEVKGRPRYIIAESLNAER